MPEKQEQNLSIKRVPKRFLANIIISWLIPLVIYTLLHSFSVKDKYAFAISAAVPVIRTTVLIIWRRKVDWIGLFGIAGFGAAFLITAVTGGSSLPLKLYHPLITGLLGIALLVSVAIGKPLLLVIIRAFRGRTGSNLGNQTYAGGLGSKRFSIVTALIGVILIADATIHIIMALTLSTGKFMISSRAVTIAIVALLIGARILLGRRSKG